MSDPTHVRLTPETHALAFDTFPLNAINHSSLFCSEIREFPLLFIQKWLLCKKIKLASLFDF